MTTSARLLSTLTLALPLAACAAQPASLQAPQPAPDVQAGGAALVPGPASASAAAPVAAQPAAADTRARSVAQPRRAATASGAATPAAPAPSAAAQPVQVSSIPAPSGNAPALDPASPAAPETTVGGGAANRSVPAPAPVTMPASSATGSLLQTLFALIVVLGVLGALAWFLKRYGPKAMGGSAHLRVVGSLSLGGRERLLVVEVGNQWIVVGASPGRVNALATMPKQEGTGTGGTGATLAPGETTATPPANSFGDWLKQTIDKRNK